MSVSELAKDPKRYELLVASITDYAIFMLDSEGRIATWNPGAERFKGYTEPEIIGQHFSRFYTDEDRAAGLPERALSLARTEGRFETEGWRLRKSGERFWAHVVIDPIRSNDGEIVGYAKITRDLSERRRAAESLAESEERFRLLVEGIADYAIYMLDPRGHVSSWNAGAQRFKGYVAEEILGKHFSRFYMPEDRESGLPAKVLETAEREGRFEGEGWRVRKDGGRFWAHVVVDAIRDPAGKLIGFAKITRDLSERKMAEEKLRHSQELFELLVQGVTDYAIYLLDTNGKIVSWNAGAERIKGYTAAEIIGQHFSRFYTEEDAAAEAPAAALATALREGKYEREALRRRKDGSLFWAHVVIDPIRDAGGKHIGFATITRDVTGRRRSEEALAEARDRLMQSQKLESVGQLTGGIAHDFNNLLTAILGSLDILKRRLPSDPRISKPLENAIAGALRGAALTQRLLAFARKQDLKIATVDVVETIRGMANLLQSSAGCRIVIETQFPLQLGSARTDGNQLELAVLNLVLNARDAMPDGGKVVIGASDDVLGEPNVLDLPAGNYVRVFVTDTGSGMDSETLARAVEPFYTTKGIGKGTGLGLPMVHGVAAQSGGRLNLKSSKGEGTTAEIWLPREAGDVALRVVHDEKDQGAEIEGSLTILIVDDDVLVLRNTAVALEDVGHDPIEVSSGQAALDVLAKCADVDLVVTDYLMPEMTGLQLAERIRAERPDLPVVLASAYGDLSSRDLKLPRLQKPFTQRELLQAVSSVLRAKRESHTNIHLLRCRQP